MLAHCCVAGGGRTAREVPPKVIRIREFTSADIPQVADVHRESMKVGDALTPALLEDYRQWLTALFLDNPMRVPGNGLESLVADDDGEIVAFMGVVARQLALDGNRYLGSVASNFCVRPGRRGGLGVQVAREYLARSSEFAFIDELTDRPRRLWDHFGMLAMPQSVRWTLPLSPGRHVVSVVSRRIGAARFAAPVVGLFDRLAQRVPRSPFFYAPPALAAEDLTGASLARILTEFGAADALRPVTTDGSTEWLMQRARAMTQHGELQAVCLRDSSGLVVGWYVYYAGRGRAGEVLQLVAAPHAAPAVLSHLALHATARGVVSLTGALDLTFLSPLSWHWATIMPTPIETRWMMVQSNKPEILEAFWRGRILLSRLDGEWCHHLR